MGLRVSVNGAVSIWGGALVDLRIGHTAYGTATVRAVDDSQNIPEE
jgi:hypothetical protein